MKTNEDYEWEEDRVRDQSAREHGVIDKDVEGETGWFVILLLKHNWLHRWEGTMYVYTYQNRLRELKIHKSIYALGKEIMLVLGFDGIDYYDSG